MVYRNINQSLTSYYPMAVEIVLYICIIQITQWLVGQCVTLGGELIKPEILKNAEFVFLLEPYDAVYT